MNRHEDHAPWHFAACTQTRHHRTPARRDAYYSPSRTPDIRLLRMHIDEGLGVWLFSRAVYRCASWCATDREYDQCSISWIFIVVACLGAIGLVVTKRALPSRTKTLFLHKRVRAAAFVQHCHCMGSMLVEIVSA